MSGQDVVTFLKHFKFSKENKTYIIGCTFKILKCPIQQPSCASQKVSCSWFQESEFNEACSLLWSNVKEMLVAPKTLPGQQQNVNINILTGEKVKLAYHIVNNPNSDKKVLTSTENDKSHDGSFEVHRFSRIEVFVSVTRSGNQKDVRRLTEILSQPCSLTGEKRIEISHYFNRPNIKDEKDPATDEPPVNMKEARLILQKVVKDIPAKKSRLRTKKRCLESVEKDAENNQPKLPETDDQANKAESHSQIQHVKDLTLQQLEESFERNSARLYSIYKGETDCKRHTKYSSGSSRQRRELDFQVNLLFYHEEQVNHAIALLKNLLAPNGNKEIDYIMRVLLPEFLIKVYMDLKGVDQELAELKMMPCGKMRNAESPVKEAK